MGRAQGMSGMVESALQPAQDANLLQNKARQELLEMANANHSVAALSRLDVTTKPETDVKVASYDKPGC